MQDRGVVRVGIFVVKHSSKVICTHQLKIMATSKGTSKRDVAHFSAYFAHLPLVDIFTY